MTARLPNNVCLLDFDGVILRNHPAHNIISKRCVIYTQKCLGIKNHEVATSLNTKLYQVTGHTLIGLRKLGITTCKEQFNHFVYKNFEYDAVFHDLRNTHKHDIQQLVNFKLTCDEFGIPLYIFSNAPNEWCYNIMEIMSPDLTCIPILNINSFKPLRRCYTEVEAKLESDHILFVDDSMVNFKNIMENTKWTKIHMGEYSAQIKPDLFMTNSLGELTSILLQKI